MQRSPPHIGTPLGWKSVLSTPSPVWNAGWDLRRLALVLCSHLVWFGLVWLFGSGPQDPGVLVPCTTFLVSSWMLRIARCRTLHQCRKCASNGTFRKNHWQSNISAEFCMNNNCTLRRLCQLSLSWLDISWQQCVRTAESKSDSLLLLQTGCWARERPSTISPWVCWESSAAVPLLDADEPRNSCGGSRQAAADEDSTL